MNAEEKLKRQRQQQQVWNKSFFDCPCGIKIKNGCKSTHKRSKGHISRMEEINLKKQDNITIQKIYELLLKINNNILLTNLTNV